MFPTQVLRASRAHKPLIKFIGKRTAPKSPDRTPHVHPASPRPSLPDSFAAYRAKAQSHGPLAGQQGSGSKRATTTQAARPDATQRQVEEQQRLGTIPGAGPQLPKSAIGARSGHELGDIAPPAGTAFDRSELPRKFGRMVWSESEIEAVESGGASQW